SYRVIRYDARGFGRSERPDEVFSHYEDLRGLLDHLGIERASLVGLSLGGRTAIDFALTHPSRVTSLVLVNVGISGYKFTGLAEYFKAASDAADRGDREMFVEVSLRQWFDGPGQPATRTAPALREEVKRLMREHTEQAARRDTRPRVQEVGAVERLGEIAAPTLIVESALDAPDAHAISALLERSIRGSRRVVIEDAALRRAPPLQRAGVVRLSARDRRKDPRFGRRALGPGVKRAGRRHVQPSGRPGRADHPDAQSIPERRRRVLVGARSVDRSVRRIDLPPTCAPRVRGVPPSSGS